MSAALGPTRLRRPCRPHRHVDIGRIRLGDLRQNLATGGIATIEPLPRTRLDPRTADKQPKLPSVLIEPIAGSRGALWRRPIVHTVEIRCDAHPIGCLYPAE